MSSELAVLEPRPTALMPSGHDWQQMLQMAEAFVKSGLLPDSVKTPAAAVVIMEQGRELGIPPMAAFSGISVIKGKPTCSAQLMMALIKRDHGSAAIRVADTTDDACTVEYRLPGWDGLQRYTFTRQQAKQAGLTDGNWSRYPAAMLRARCISAVARMAFPESIGGMYVADEVGGDVEVTAEGEVIAAPPTVTVRELRPATATDEDRINRSQMSRLHGAAAERGYDHAAVKAHAAADCGVASTKDLTAHQAAQEITWWETTPEDAIHERMGSLLGAADEQSAAAVIDGPEGTPTSEIVQPALNNRAADWEILVREATTQKALYEIRKQIKAAGIDSEELRQAYESKLRAFQAAL